MTFQTEKEFEEALISQLTKKGWEENIKNIRPRLI